MVAGNALVTHGSGDIGRAIALYLAERGFNIAVHHDDTQSNGAANSVVADAQGKGVQAVVLEAASQDSDAMGALVDLAAKALGGPLSVLVNVATEFEPDSLTSATSDSFDQHVSANLKTPFVLARAFAAQSGPVSCDEFGEPIAPGLIVNVMAQQVLKATSNHLTNSLASRGLLALTRSGALDLAPAIRVNAIAMHSAITHQRQIQKQTVDPWRGTVPHSIISTDDVVAIFEYFLSSPAVTGQLLSVEGRDSVAPVPAQ